MTGSDPIDPFPENAADALNQRQLVDYRDFRSRLLEWMRDAGKDPAQNTGLAETTVKNYANRIDQFFKWLWEEIEGYTTGITGDHADRFVDQLLADQLRQANGEPYKGGTKRKHVDAVRKLFEWRSVEFGEPPWETDVTFSESRYNHADAFSTGERQALRDGALELGSIPAYNDLSPDERDRWKAFLAQKFGKPKTEVSPDDWDRVNTSWKMPSLVNTALDAGLRPIEIERSVVGWLRLQKGALFIPKEDSSKNRDNWEVALQPRTVLSLERWLVERENFAKYDGREAIWLNQRGNSYNSATLNYLLDELLEVAGIDQANRDLSWYSIRHSVGTHMSSRGTLAETQEQLRHKSLDSTLRYTNPPVEERQETLEKIG